MLDVERWATGASVMKKCLFTICFSSALLVTTARAEDDRPILKESPARLVACMESTARANLLAGYVNITRDTAQKSLRIYAVALPAKAGKFKQDGYAIEVIYNNELALQGKTATGPYHHQHNAVMLTFAAAQFASGKKEFGLYLIKLLASAEPDLFWSSPTHPVMTLQQIIAGLEKKDGSVAEFLKDEHEQWADILKSYGP
jgi:hypothetical protein